MTRHVRGTPSDDDHRRAASDERVPGAGPTVTVAVRIATTAPRSSRRRARAGLEPDAGRGSGRHGGRRPAPPSRRMAATASAPDALATTPLTTRSGSAPPSTIGRGR